MKNLSIEPEAIEVIKNQEKLCEEVKKFYGKNSPEYVDIVDSRNDCLSFILKLGGKLYANGEYDVYGETEYVIYGMNFNPNSKFDPLDGLDGVPMDGKWRLQC